MCIRDSLYTRKKEDVSKENKSEGKKTGKDAASEKVHSTLSKEQKKKLKKDMVQVSALSGLAKGSETVRDYLSHGSDENKGVEAGEKTADASSKPVSYTHLDVYKRQKLYNGVRIIY